MSNRIFVSGGSGYIAGFLIRLLLEQGWTVHTSIRDLQREAALRSTLAADSEHLRVFAADLLHDAGWDEAMQGCSHVAHVASPLPAHAPRHDDELIVPAREGALRALRAAQRAGVRRFVMTSSMAAVAYGHDNKERFTEADWTDPASPDAYAYVRSKTLAERAARDWVAANGKGLEFVTVNPTLVLGPLLSADYSTSLEVIRKMLIGALPGLPRFGFGIVDVRDVAELHLRCLTAPGLAGERFIASGPFLWLHEIAALLKDGLGPQARRVPTRRLPDWTVHVASWFDPLVRQVIAELGHRRDADTRHAAERLGWTARPVEQTLLDTARSLIEHGVVKG